MSLGGGEILVILLVTLIVFGPQRLPEIARQVGKAMREVRKMQDSLRQEISGALKLDEHDGVGVPNYSEPQHIDVSSTDVTSGDHPTPSPSPQDPPSSGSFS